MDGMAATARYEEGLGTLRQGRRESEYMSIGTWRWIICGVRSFKGRLLPGSRRR